MGAVFSCSEKFACGPSARHRDRLHTGWRIHDEIFSRQKHHADLKGRGWLRLDPGETKNGEGRNFPFTVRLREIIAQQLERTKALEKATGRIIPWLFHRAGRPIK